MTVFIGGAWPYVNGRLHVGHIASLLPGDVLARYFRITGEEVLYVSGSDCHGTPISVLADREKVSPGVIADKYHREITDCFEWLGFSYDLYTRTDSEHHRQVVQDVFLDLYRNGFLYEKEVLQAYCAQCGRFLPDRFIEGTCPKCGQTARGDQCDSCSTLLDPLELINGRCKICGTHHEIRETKHLFLALSRFQTILESYADKAKSNWRENAVNLTNRYLADGLKDRAVTRDLSWGIDVPIAGYEGKKIYVWIEAVLGYLSASIKWAESNQTEWQKFWGDQVTAYYVHGKDNIPFHSLILPALLLGSKQLHLPDKIVSSEYLTIEGKKISTSLNWAIWASELKGRYHPDSIRYYLIANSPESRDTDFSWREFVYQHNSELLGDFGNFVNRTLVFAQKYFDSKVPLAHISPDLHAKIDRLYLTTGEKIAQAELKGALEEVFAFVRYANKYFDQSKPWKLIAEDPQQCKQDIFNCIQIIVNLANLLTPFLPHSCDKVRHILGLKEAVWEYSEVAGNHSINEPEILFKRIDKAQIEEEVKNLHGHLQ